MNAFIQAFQGKKTHLTSWLVILLLLGQWQHWWTIPNEIYLALCALALTFLRAGVARDIGDASLGAPASAGLSAPTTAQAAPNTGQPPSVVDARPGGLGAAMLWTFVQGTIAILAGSGVCLWLVLLSPGCATQLAPGGVYSGDPFLYWADQTVVTTTTALDDFEAWELVNYSYLTANAPGVVETAEIIRTNAPACYNDYLSARSAYKLLFSAASSNGLLSAVMTYTNLQSGAVTNAIP
jgi:hypothetical protein